MKHGTTIRRLAILAALALLAGLMAAPQIAAREAPEQKPGATTAPSQRTFTHPEDVVVNGTLTIEDGAEEPQLNLIRTGTPDGFDDGSWRIRSTAGDLDFFDVSTGWLPFYIQDGLDAAGVSMILGPSGLDLFSGDSTGNSFYPDGATIGSPGATGVIDIINFGDRANFFMRDTSQSSGWLFGTRGSGFEVNRGGSGGTEFRFFSSGRVIMGPGPLINFDLSPSGNLKIAGTITDGSGTTLNDLAAVNESLRAENDQLRDRVGDLEARMASLETMLADLNGQ